MSDVVLGINIVSSTNSSFSTRRLFIFTPELFTLSIALSIIEQRERTSFELDPRFSAIRILSFPRAFSISSSVLPTFNPFSIISFSILPLVSVS